MSTRALTVGALLARRPDAGGLDLALVAGAAGLDRQITNPHVQKTGLALSGYDRYLHQGRILVLGDSEIRFLEEQTPAERAAIVARILRHDLPCVLVTNGLVPGPEIAQASDTAAVPLLATGMGTGIAIARVTALLEDQLAERMLVHADLVDILGLGVLITGESGVGKSECALELVTRGHRLVADDTVEVRRRSESFLIGTCPAPTRFYMEVRGLGLIDVRDLFGIAAVRSSKRVELVVQLERWESGRDYDRLGLDEQWHDLLGLRVPMVRMPVAPGRSVATLVEVAARNQLLKSRGSHAARRLADRLHAGHVLDDEELDPGGSS